MKDGANWYVYCANNPLKFVDINGKNTDSLAIHSAAGSLAMSDGFLPFGDFSALGLELGYCAGGVVDWLNREEELKFTGSLNDALKELSGNVNSSMDPNNFNDFKRFRNTKPNQDHHLINQAQKNHPLIKKASELGIDFKTESWNLINMPHQGGHTAAYYQYVKMNLDFVYDLYINSGAAWTVNEMRLALRNRQILPTF